METRTEWFVWHPAMEPLTQEQVRQYIAYRHSCGLTNVKIADEIGMSSKRVSEIDLGNPKQTGRAQLRIISKLLSAMWPGGIPLSSVVKTSRDSTEGDAARAFGPTVVRTVQEEDGSEAEVVPKAQFDEVWEALGVATRAVEELQPYKQRCEEYSRRHVDMANRVYAMERRERYLRVRMAHVHATIRNFGQLLSISGPYFLSQWLETIPVTDHDDEDLDPKSVAEWNYAED